MFCFSAYSCVRLIASGFSVATRSQSWPSSRSATLRSGRFDAITSRLVAGGGIAEPHAQRLAFAGDAAVPDVALAQLRAQVAGEALQALGDRRLPVHLQQEVH